MLRCELVEVLLKQSLVTYQGPEEKNPPICNMPTSAGVLPALQCTALKDLLAL